ncbi:ribosome biogenesis protein ERB1 [Marchantia polymorpha subsp. ruderalis]|uniref:Ribosome biogenesis protein BOP1 homolog n=1 Tax=Marchantia polymorpha TaxID=3197 RepID=A0A2R6XBC7_MARPO|nr:hypothetical protein MARPO_0025s0073 [Marchantia polymorpha]BBN03750.1 hypothetical protein Mp_2g26050 [Marchantia polymorpha subsp. ruderalis]|eukprot:PTQ43382.1 hypothetical protein MARPO_0025s0073 [Marchantia polymorpha]
MGKVTTVKRKLRSGGVATPAPQSDSDSDVKDDLKLDEESEEESPSNSDAEDVSDSDVFVSDDEEEEDSDADDEVENAMRALLTANGAGNSEDSDGDDSDYVSGGSDSEFDDSDDEGDDSGSEEEGAGAADNNVGGKVVDSTLAKVSEENAGEGNGTGVKAVEESDSEDDGELNPRNTIGDVPLEWYRDEKHIGYDKDGKKITKQERKDQLDAFLSRADDSKDWRRLYDEYNDEEIILTKDEIKMINKLREGRTPHEGVNPHEEYTDWFEWEDKGHPLSNAPEPKRRFIPSKWEAKKVVKLVRALRKGWISLEKPKEKPKYYMLWGDDLQTAERTANGLAYIPAPKPKLPGHEESYNPPEEYIPTQEEINAYQLMYEEDRPKYIPKQFDSLRQVPAYSDYIKERFERCLDLYLCPRSRKKRINIDPESLVPKLPKPKDLQPFPTTCYLEFRGHTGIVCTLATSPSGEWLASGSQDGSVRIWEVQTGRCRKIWEMGSAVKQIAWNPNPQISILAVAVENEVVLVNSETGPEEDEANLLTLLTVVQKPKAVEDETPLTKWIQHEEFKGIRLRHHHVVHSVAWHYKGDYIVTVAPDANTRAVLVHQLSKQLTQNPFRKHHGRVVSVLFHPTRPFLFVATKIHVRVYNLAKQQLSKKLLTSLHEISSMAVHPGGDNLILGSKEAKLAWFDMDLSTKPYKILKNHSRDIRSVAYHKKYPLFATCSDDSTAHVFHGMVYSDLLQNPLIVPVKVLRGHQNGIFDCEFHPKQPWLFTAGGDEVIRLYCN